VFANILVAVSMQTYRNVHTVVELHFTNTYLLPTLLDF